MSISEKRSNSVIKKGFIKEKKTKTFEKLKGNQEERVRFEVETENKVKLFNPKNASK